MKVLLSWSGSQSRLIAEALRVWLEDVVQALEPWVSTVDISAGATWHSELSSTLDACSFGVLCLTKSNLSSKWLLFEAGAVSRAVTKSRVVPYLLGVSPDDLDGPLSHFQASVADREGTWRLVKALNTAVSQCAEKSLASQQLEKSFARCWPELELKLAEVLLVSSASLSAVGPETALPSVRDLLEDQQSLMNRLKSLEARFPTLPPDSLNT